MTVTDILQLNNIHEAAPTDAIDGVQPCWVAEPATTEEASTILRFATQHNLAVAPRGGGTKLGWGNPPERLDLILSTARMNRVLEHAAGDLVARLEAGTRLRDAQEVFARAGQWLPIDPPEADATIGGVVAANAFGPHRLRYGTMRDLLIGITYVLPDGTVAKAGGKVVKNVAGYDLCKLFTGSLGTLGLLTEVIVRLHPLPVARRMVLSSHDGTFQDALQALLHSTLVPSAIDFRLGRTATLAVLFEGVEPGVEAQASGAERLLFPFAVPPQEGPDPTRDGGRRPRISPDREENSGSVRLPALSEGWTRVKITVPVAALAEMLNETVSQTRLVWNTGYGIRGYAASGIIYVDMDSDPERQLGAIRALREQARRHGGSVVIQDAPIEVKRLIDVWGDAGDALPLMRRVKERFDPNRIMNPGRFIGGI